MGMITFGTMMMVANLAFVEPSILERWWENRRVDRKAR
jgi:hypothetical protein